MTEEHVTIKGKTPTGEEYTASNYAPYPSRHGSGYGSHYPYSRYGSGYYPYEHESRGYSEELKEAVRGEPTTVNAAGSRRYKKSPNFIQRIGKISKECALDPACRKSVLWTGKQAIKLADNPSEYFKEVTSSHEPPPQQDSVQKLHETARRLSSSALGREESTASQGSEVGRKRSSGIPQELGSETMEHVSRAIDQGMRKSIINEAIKHRQAQKRERVIRAGSGHQSSTPHRGSSGKFGKLTKVVKIATKAL
jgi:hypothetical protein